jgi:hypothetical protein
VNEIADLTDDVIKQVLKTEKELNLFITAHLYLEHFLDLAIDKQFPLQEHLLDVPYFSTDLKLRILHGNGFLSDVLYLNGKMMNEIRNKFAHNLNPNQNSIGSKIEKMVLPWHPPSIVNAMDKFEKYKNVAIATITNVKNALEEDRDAVFYPEVKIPDSEK